MTIPGKPTEAQLDLDQVEHDARSGWKLPADKTLALVGEVRAERREKERLQGELRGARGLQAGYAAGDETLLDLMDGQQ